MTKQPKQEMAEVETAIKGERKGKYFYVDSIENHLTPKPTETWRVKAKESIAGVIRATTAFIQGEMTLEQREAVYDTHMSFIQSELDKQLEEIERKIDKKCFFNDDDEDGQFLIDIDQVHAIIEQIKN